MVKVGKEIQRSLLFSFLHFSTDATPGARSVSLGIEPHLVKQLALILSLTIPAHIAIGQLFNGGFETCSNYPTAPGQISLVSGWSNGGSASATPDFYHYAGNMAGDIPVTPVANVNAHGGSGIVGFMATGPHLSNRREYISTALTAPLTPGTPYLLSFFLTNGSWTPGSLAGLKTSHIGAYFSQAAVSQSSELPIPVNPHCVIDTAFYSRDWVKVSFSFTPTVAYEHLTIGVFGDDGNKTIDYVEGDNTQIAYYFIDDVALVPEMTSGFDPLTDSSEREDPPVQSGSNTYLGEQQWYVPNAFSPNDDGENDFFLPILPRNVEDFRFQVYSRWGQLVFESFDPSKGWDGRVRGGEKAEAGTYVWQVDFLVIEGDAESSLSEQGSVTLLR